jgi:SAM-dependent methyltransferase
VNNSYYTSWDSRAHAKAFNVWATISLKQLRKYYESFNEIKLLLKNKASINGKTLVEVGCATGELYRYINHYHSQFDYYGFDISQVAIEQAKQKYQHGKFFITDTKLSNLNDTLEEAPDVLFARDVVLHQTDPFDFLAKLISIPDEVAILRIRTRDKGETVLDPEISCQWNYGTWVPYMVLNIDEVVEKIKNTVNFKSLYIFKSYRQLGGYNNRYLPKDCFYPETGTSETALYIQLAKDGVSNPDIFTECRSDSNPKLTLIERGIGLLKRQILEK